MKQSSTYRRQGSQWKCAAHRALVAQHSRPKVHTLEVLHQSQHAVPEAGGRPLLAGEPVRARVALGGPPQRRKGAGRARRAHSGALVGAEVPRRAAAAGLQRGVGKRPRLADHAALGA